MRATRTYRLFGKKNLDDPNGQWSEVDDGKEDSHGNRWYDLNSTVRTAINMLENCPFSTQKAIAKEMAKLVVDKIKEDTDEKEAEL